MEEPIFNPDPERENAYYEVYNPANKLIGKSNRVMALNDFGLKLCEAEKYEGYYIVFNGEKYYFNRFGSMSSKFFEDFHK